MVPAHYLGSTYFERWLDGITRLFVEKGVVKPAELEARTAAYLAHPDAPPAAPAGPIPKREGPPSALTFFREATTAPRFAVGAAVVTRHTHPPGHTRLPRSARANRGVIAAYRGCNGS